MEDGPGVGRVVVGVSTTVRSIPGSLHSASTFQGGRRRKSERRTARGRGRPRAPQRFGPVLTALAPLDHCACVRGPDRRPGGT